jgi:hypothetical protein
VVGQESVSHDLGLLLDAVAFEPLPRLDVIVVAAKGVAAQHQAQPLLVLSDMGHLVDEQALEAEVCPGEIDAGKRAVRVKP